MQLIRELERARDETLQCFSLEPRAVRNAIIYYAGVHYDRSDHLEFVHSVDGVRTLRDEFDKVAAHNEHHLRQIRVALGRLPGTAAYAAR